MFDRCRAWRVMLTRRAEGVLSPSERAMLDNHISKCGPCRKARLADDALQALNFAPDLGLSPGTGRTFDDRVVGALRAAPLTEPPAGWRERVRACAGSLSFEFCMQLAGGGLAAASITAFALVSALSPAPRSRGLSTYEVHSISAAERNQPPVPLESLFQSTTPRAAMLWAAPGRPAALQRPAQIPANGGRSLPRRHGAVSHSLYAS